MNFLAHLADNIFVENLSLGKSLADFYQYTISSNWLLRRTLYWLIIFPLKIETNDFVVISSGTKIFYRFEKQGRNQDRDGACLKIDVGHARSHSWFLPLV